MNDIQKRTITALAKGIAGTIAHFEQQCARQQYTDTGEAWDILRALQQDAERIRRAAREIR